MQALTFFANSENIKDFHNQYSFESFVNRLFDSIERYREGMGDNPLKGLDITFYEFEIKYIKSKIIPLFIEILFPDSEKEKISTVLREKIFTMFNIS